MTSPMDKAMDRAKEAVAAAKVAADTAAYLQWEADGKQDCGSCGGAMLRVNKGSMLYKAMLAAGLTDGSAYLQWRMPEGIRTQHAEVQIKAYRAFKSVLEAHGYGSFIAKFWTYID